MYLLLSANYSILFLGITYSISCEKQVSNQRLSESAAKRVGVQLTVEANYIGLVAHQEGFCLED